MAITAKLFGDPNAKALKKLQPLVNKINELEPNYLKMSDADLKGQTVLFRERLDKGETLDDLLPEAFAVAREVAKRTLNQRHYDVQLIGGIVLHKGQITEMRTGEGKTLTATLPVYLNALAGKGVHVITVNDYLAGRDAEWMGKIYDALGLSIGVIQHDTAFLYKPATTEQVEGEEVSYLEPVTRKEAYAADITYGTNNEYGFDYLRDNMVTHLDQKVQRGHYFTIVDEVDSILIDEARTPLIISAPAEESAELYYQFAKLVKQLKEDEDYNVDEKLKSAILTEEGINKMEKWLGVENIYDEGGITNVHHIEQALRAHALYRLDRDYVVREGEVIIVDEFTGRMMEGRRYSEGLHQAIEAKEGVDIQRESQTLATITFQNYFRMYEKLTGMTGTAETEAEEFAKIYNLEVLVIPTNKPIARADMIDRIYKSEQGKFKAVAQEIKRLHEKGQPVLVGTISIEKNEILGELLAREGVPHEILNAKNHGREADIIAQAGRRGAVTIATNMAGRGVDIILGGSPVNKEEQKKVLDLGGLHVIGTERHESRRIDNQLRGRSGRQGDPGSTQFYVSLEDDLMRIFGSDRIKSVMEKLGLPEDASIENKMISKSLETAQRKVEGHNFDIRKRLVDFDDVINRHREVIYGQRNEILQISEGKKEGSTFDLIKEMIEGEIEQLVSFHTADENQTKWNIKEIYETANSMFPIPSDLKLQLEELREKAGGPTQDVAAREAIIKYLITLADDAYSKLEKSFADNTEIPKNAMREIEKGMMLQSIDSLWVEHLEAMSHLRTGIGLRGYGQRDPLIEYKKESFRLYNELNNTIQKQVVYSIFKVGIAQKVAPSLMQRQGVSLSGAAKTMSQGQKLHDHAGEPGQEPVKERNTYEGKKVGRNDECPCGSGKKFKRCHGV